MKVYKSAISVKILKLTFPLLFIVIHEGMAFNDLLIHRVIPLPLQINSLPLLLRHQTNLKILILHNRPLISLTSNMQSSDINIFLVSFLMKDILVEGILELEARPPAVFGWKATTYYRISSFVDLFLFACKPIVDVNVLHLVQLQESYYFFWLLFDAH